MEVINFTLMLNYLNNILEMISLMSLLEGKMYMKKIIILIVQLLIFNSCIIPSFAQEELPIIDDSNYLEVQSGGEIEIQKNNQIINEFETNSQKETRGSGVSCYPSVPTYKQDENYYCGPACLQMVLKHITDIKYSQSSLASLAETNKSDGTYVFQMRDVLNAKQSSYKYAYTTVSSQSDLKSKIGKSISKNAPVIFHAKTAPLKMYNGKNLGHYLVGHTIYVPGSETTTYITYNDPWYKDYGNGSVYGSHTDTLANFYKSLTSYGSRYLIYSG